LIYYLVFALSGLGGENDGREWKGGDGRKEFEEHWIRRREMCRKDRTDEKV